MTVAGLRPLVLTADMDGEFFRQSAEEVYASLGLASRLRAPEAHADGAESVHRYLYHPVRPAMLTGDVPLSLWKEACVWAAGTHNYRAAAGIVPHVQLSGSWSDLTPLTLFYSPMAAFNNSGSGGRFNSRSLLSRHIGPA